MENFATKEEIIIAAWLHVLPLYSKGYNKLLGIIPENVDEAVIKRLVENWQNPSSYDEWIIAQADNLSRGVKERKKESAFYDNPIPLIHLVSTLQIPNRAKPKTGYCRFTTLEADGILPVEQKGSASKEDYQALWKKFEDDFEALKGLPYDAYLKALNSLLERYWWCIPAGNDSDSESLYQQSKMPVALASALYVYHKDTETEDLEALKDQTCQVFRFIKGDISGIQKYIFDLKTTKENAKLLRAKSFQLVAISEILSQYIVKKFEVPYANIIMSAGGNFMLLIPNSDKAKKLLSEIQLEIESYFLKEYAGKLAIIISDGIEASGADLLKENVQNLMNKIGENADFCKQKKMQKALCRDGAVLSDFYSDLQQYGECPKCGVFPASGIGGDGQPCECADCKKLTEIGGTLVRAGSVFLDSSTLRPFAQMVKVSRKDDLEDGYTINTFIPGQAEMYMPYTAPEGKNGILTFEEIAAKSTGNNKLAMFKSDIDNLGLVFSASLGDRMSFSRYAELSHQLHYFFSAYYTWFVHNHNYVNHIYTVFSGGDDLCILGAWDAVLQFAADFEMELKKFTLENPSISLSGGIVLSSPNVPVKNIAADAEENLDCSKGRMENGQTVKNAISVFRTTVSWPDYRESLKAGSKLKEYLDNKTLSKGVVYKLLDFANRAERIQAGKVGELIAHDHIWKSNFKYIVSRNIDNEKKKEWFMEFGSSPESIIKSRIAVSYALYTQRNS